MVKTILLIEDNLSLQNFIKQQMQDEYIVKVIKDFNNLQDEINDIDFDLVILDLNLPTVSGRELLVSLQKKNPFVKIIVNTSDTTYNTEIELLKLGVDDYVKKPIDIQILKLRVQKLLKLPEGIIKYQDITIDVNKMLLNQKVTLTKNDLIILTYLIKSKEEVVNTNSILKQLWDNDEFVQKSALAMALTRLRKKLKQADVKTNIITIRGEGVKIQ